MKFIYQGMVHEPIRKEGNWLYPNEIKRLNNKKVVKKSDNSEVIVGPPESMSKSKKNTIDPESMINDYGSDSVRWFILSESPPEKDVQWSDIGVASANKFLQKIWNLNFLISTKIENKINKFLEKKFSNDINIFVNKIDRAINDFRFNVAIAHFYEIYNYFKSNMNKDIK